LLLPLPHASWSVLGEIEGRIGMLQSLSIVKEELSEEEKHLADDDDDAQTEEIHRPQCAFFGTAPVLTRVKFTRVTYLTSFTLPWAQIRDVSLHHCTFSNIQSVLQLCDTLQRLEILTSFDLSEITIAQWLDVAHLCNFLEVLCVWTEPEEQFDNLKTAFTEAAANTIIEQAIIDD
jgi:hypothetical protein